MTERALVCDVLDKAVFGISLDTELAWGFTVNSKNETPSVLYNDPKQGRSTIDSLLKLLDKYEIPATWAIVGHLFLGPAKEKAFIHRKMPQFTEGWLDWNFYSSLEHNPLYYGKDIVERILAAPLKHEIGLHSFFHIPFSLCSREVAEAEVELGMKAAKKFGITPISFVMPKNKIGNVGVLKENRFQIYRGETLGRRSDNQLFLARAFNGGIDKIIASPSSPLYEDGIWKLPGSMYFCDPQIPFSLLPRARLGLSRAIQANKVFHIFLHPWNLLMYKRLRRDLESFLAIVDKKRNEGKLEVMTMGDLALYLNQSLGGI